MFTTSKKVIAGIALAALAAACGPKGPNKDDKAELWLTMPDKSVLFQKQEQQAVTTPADTVITIHPEKTFQEMDGFGYALTGGSALHLSNMSKDARAKLLQELFGTGKNDIGISYLRISIGSSDLDEAVFSYDDLPAGQTDPKLEKFDLGYDKKYLIPVLKEILAINPDIKILGSPWSAPAWMKDNGDTRGGSLKEEYFDTYAQYFVKYIQAMKDNGITIDAVTVQNEPLNPDNNPSMKMLPFDQKLFVRDHLGPAFEKNGIKTKIIIYDHNADRADYPIGILADPQAAKYIDGSAFHLYGGTIDELAMVHKRYPDKNLYFTEEWVGAPVKFGKELEWHTENLIIGAPRNWCKNVLEWNLASNSDYEPHTDRGGCDRCVGAVTIQGDTITREPAYYIIAHASKFVRPGSVRIDSNMPSDVPNVAYKTPDGKIVINLMNKAKQEKTVKVINGDAYAVVKLLPGEVGTLIL